MKILFLAESYLPKTSGVPMVVKYLAEGLVDRGYDVSLCTRFVDGTPREEIINGVKIYRFNLIKTLLKAYKGEIEEYRDFVLSSNADVIIFECSECVTTDVLLRHLDKIKGKKIFHSHGFSGMTLHPFKWNVNLKYSLGNTYNWLRFKWYYNITFKNAAKKFDSTMCLSEIDSSREWLKKNAKEVVVLQNAVDDMFCDATKENVQKDLRSLDKPYFISVATYSKQKNQIGIVREFYKADTDYALVFVGPQETEYYRMLKAEIENLRQQYGERTILTLMKVPRSYIPDIIGNAKLYLVGSTFEEYSISLIEAMAKGVPFISTNVGNARILPGGITVNSIDEMHDRICSLLNDDTLYRDLSNKGKNFVAKNCRRERTISQLIDIISEKQV